MCSAEQRDGNHEKKQRGVDRHDRTAGNPQSVRQSVSQSVSQSSLSCSPAFVNHPFRRSMPFSGACCAFLRFFAGRFKHIFVLFI